jgi:hypothetical protein
MAINRILRSLNKTRAAPFSGYEKNAVSQKYRRINIEFMQDSTVTYDAKGGSTKILCGYEDEHRKGSNAKTALK